MIEPPERAVQVAAGRIRHVTLEVTVENAAHLPRMDSLGKCDAFCRLQWTGAAVQTQHILKSYEPVWDETFAFRPFDICGAAPPPVPPFSISLSDYDSPTSHTEFGVVEIGEGLMGKVADPSPRPAHAPEGELGATMCKGLTRGVCGMCR